MSASRLQTSLSSNTPLTLTLMHRLRTAVLLYTRCFDFDASAKQQVESPHFCVADAKASHDLVSHLSLALKGQCEMEYNIITLELAIYS